MTPSSAVTHPTAAARIATRVGDDPRAAYAALVERLLAISDEAFAALDYRDLARLVLPIRAELRVVPAE
jgi:hypothetical protein